VGDGDALGNWDAAKAAKMKWSEGHTWSVSLPFVPGTKVTYKVRLHFACHGDARGGGSGCGARKHDNCVVSWLGASAVVYRFACCVGHVHAAEGYICMPNATRNVVIQLHSVLASFSTGPHLVSPPATCARHKRDKQCGTCT
jgi:hypothetical protein